MAPVQPRPAEWQVLDPNPTFLLPTADRRNDPHRRHESASAQTTAAYLAALPDKDSADRGTPARVSPGRTPKRRWKARLKALSEL
jgi:hypothetical protein